MKNLNKTLMILAAALLLTLAMTPLTALATPMGAWEFQYREDPTCTTEGYDVYYNFITLETEHRNVIPALGHDWGPGVVTKEPSCREVGYREYTCRRCGETKVEYIPVTNDHEFEYIYTKEPTCTEDGCEYWGCHRCNKEKNIPIPALGHDWGEWKTLTAATCTGDGLKVHSCSRCGIRETAPIPALGHAWDGGKVTKEANCLEAGERLYTCTRCGATRKETIPASGSHLWGEWKVEYPGTCVTQGMNVRRCTRCGAEEYVYSGYGDHDWGEWQAVKEPTATEEGLRQRVCKNDKSHVETETIPATGAAKYVLKGLNLHYTKIIPGSSGMWPGSPTVQKVVWADAEPAYSEQYSLTISVLWVDPAKGDKYPESRLEGMPEVGQTYYWDVGVYNLINSDHSIDFSQVDMDQVNVAIDGFVLELIGIERDRGANDSVYFCYTATYLGQELNPAITVTRTYEPDAGKDKRVLGAMVETHYEITNSGNCTVWVPWFEDHAYNMENGSAPHGREDRANMGMGGGGVARLDPGETYSCTAWAPVDAKAVKDGYVFRKSKGYAWYYDEKGNVKYFEADGNNVNILITYPQDGEPEPSLKIEWTHDNYYPNSDMDDLHSTKSVDTFNPEDGVYAHINVYNTGNVTMKIRSYVTYGDGFMDPKYMPGGHVLSVRPVIAPDEFSKDNWGYRPISLRITPGSGTENLMGVVTITIWCTGHDPYTDELLCTSNTVTRTWYIRSSSEKTESASKFALYQMESSHHGNPNGYQLMEAWSVDATIHNTGTVDVPEITINDCYWDGPVSGTENNGGAGYPVDSKTPYTVGMGTVTEDDVKQKSIIMSPSLTWIDPQDETEQSAVATPESVVLPVTSKTGLLLKKTRANDPANGSYYQFGESIEWKLTVTNNSKESIMNVTVTDQGAEVGKFELIKPGETVECQIPSHKVTLYDVAVVGYVCNQAYAVGTPLQGDEKTFNSNLVYAPTSLKGSILHPITGGGGGGIADGGGGGMDYTGMLHGVNVVTAIDKDTAHGPANGDYYEEDEVIDYVITVRNDGDTALENVTVTDSLNGLSPIGAIPSLAPHAEYPFTFQHTVTPGDIDYGWVINQAVVEYQYLGGVKGIPQVSTEKKVKAGENGGDSHTDDGDGGHIPSTGSGEYCVLTLDALGSADLQYTLHACQEHTAAAEAAESAGNAGDWQRAAEIWREEIEKLYQDLYDAANPKAKVIVLNDRAVFWTYEADYEAMREAMNPATAPKAVAEMLRLRCAELCCMKNAAPDQLPGSLMVEYADVEGSAAYDACARIIAALISSDSGVEERLNAELALTLSHALSTIDEAESDAALARAFIQVQAQWQMALDQYLGAVFEAADEETQLALGDWRILLDEVFTARKELLKCLYGDNDAAIQEALSILYKDAALEAYIGR